MNSLPADVIRNGVLPHLSLDDKMCFLHAFPKARASELMGDTLHLKAEDMVWMFDYYRDDILELDVAHVVGPLGERLSKRLMYMVGEVESIPHFDDWYDARNNRGCTCAKCATVSRWIDRIREFIQKADVRHLRWFPRVGCGLLRRRISCGGEEEWRRCPFAPSGPPVWSD